MSGDKDEVEFMSGSRMESSSNVLRKVSIPDAFLFFTDAEHYTGEFATSLTNLVKKLERVPLKSIEFHFQRGDLERWVGRTLGDSELADSLHRIDRTMRGEELRATIREIIRRRVEELGGTV